MIAWECACQPEEQVVQEAAAVVDAAAAVLRPHFPRFETHRHASDYLRGLLAEVERKNGWQLAEQAGYLHPRGIPRVQDRYVGDHNAVRDDRLRYVVVEFGDAAGSLVVDETGFLKRGKHSAGVARQYSGTLGKIANCQVGVFLGYASPKGQVALDRELFFPKEWCTDRQRCRKAGIPEEVAHQTKPQFALTMLERALDAGVPPHWVTGDEVYGSDGKLRRALEARDQGYVLAVRSNEYDDLAAVCAPDQTTVATVLATVPPQGWRRLSCGEGAGSRGMTGSGRRSIRHFRKVGSIVCWCADIPIVPTSWPTIWCMPRRARRSPKSCGSLGHAGVLMTCSS